MRSAPLRFEDFELDPVSYELRSKGIPVKIERIPMELLLLLTSRPGEVVTRAEIIEKLWGNDVFLDTENGINTAIRKVRLALQDDPERPRFVLTVAGRGYRFIAAITDGRNSLIAESTEGRPAAMQPTEVPTSPTEAHSQVDVLSSARSEGNVRRWLVWVAAAMLVSVAIALALRFMMHTPNRAQPVRVSADIGTDASLYTEYGPAAILSPDSTRLAFVATSSDKTRRIYVRSLDQLQATALAGTEDAFDHFFSPDGQWLGFFAEGKLKKISIHGGAAVTLCDAPNSRGGSWGEDGNIVFTPTNAAGLFRVSSSGGAPEALTSIDTQAQEATERWPQVLSGANAVLFTLSSVVTNYQDAEIAVYSLSTRQRKTLLRGGSYARYVPTGHLIYMHEGTLFGAPFDLKRLELTGKPTPVLEDVVSVPLHGGAQYSVSETGNLVYVAGRNDILNLAIYWMDREGKFTPLRETPASYYDPTFSPDGKRLALDIYDGKRTDVWVYEWERDTLSRFTSDGASSYSPVWTPDSQRVTYSSAEKGGGYAVYWKRTDGNGDALRLAETKTPLFPASWRPDGKVLALVQLNSGAATTDIYSLSVEGDEQSGWKSEEPKLFLKGAFSPAFSPDGRWMAYASSESGSWEVYVQPFPGPGGKWQISTGGGAFPVWSRNGREFFYRTEDDKIMVATYTPSRDSFHAHKPLLWSPGQFTNRGGNFNFALHPDGKRMAVLKTSGSGEMAPANKVRFIFNFLDMLRREVPKQK